MSTDIFSLIESRLSPYTLHCLNVGHASKEDIVRSHRPNQPFLLKSPFEVTVAVSGESTNMRVLLTTLITSTGVGFGPLFSGVFMDSDSDRTKPENIAFIRKLHSLDSCDWMTILGGSFDVTRRTGKTKVWSSECIDFTPLDNAVDFAAEFASYVAELEQTNQREPMQYAALLFPWLKKASDEQFHGRSLIGYSPFWRIEEARTLALARLPNILYFQIEDSKFRQ